MLTHLHAALPLRTSRSRISVIQICSIARCASGVSMSALRVRTRGTRGRWRSRAQAERRKRAPARALRKRSATADIANRDSVNCRWPTETLAYGALARLLIV
jgi:hypothetical protein